MMRFHMGQTMAECDCPHPEVCAPAERCIAAVPVDQHLNSYARCIWVMRACLIVAGISLAAILAILWE